MKKDYISVIITAAGKSSRMGMGKSKQFIKIGNRMVIERTLDVFSSISEIDEIIIVIRAQDKEFLVESILNKNDYNKNINVIIGGETREKSTLNGLKNLNPLSDIVICHDGARPNHSLLFQQDIFELESRNYLWQNYNLPEIW